MFQWKTGDILKHHYSNWPINVQARPSESVGHYSKKPLFMKTRNQNDKHKLEVKTGSPLREELFKF